jgi:hypothetical protein
MQQQRGRFVVTASIANSASELHARCFAALLARLRAGLAAAWRLEQGGLT